MKRSIWLLPWDCLWLFQWDFTDTSIPRPPGLSDISSSQLSLPLDSRFRWNCLFRWWSWGWLRGALIGMACLWGIGSLGGEIVNALSWRLGSAEQILGGLRQAKMIWPVASHIRKGPADLAVLVARGLPDRVAKVTLEEGLRFDPWNTNYLLASARLEALLGNSAAAQEFYLRARKTSPKSAFFQVGLAPQTGQGQSQMNLGRKGEVQ